MLKKSNWLAMEVGGIGVSVRDGRSAVTNFDFFELKPAVSEPLIVSTIISSQPTENFLLIT
jgi:hypothetical protein